MLRLHHVFSLLSAATWKSTTRGWETCWGGNPLRPTTWESESTQRMDRMWKVRWKHDVQTHCMACNYSNLYQLHLIRLELIYTGLFLFGTHVESFYVILLSLILSMFPVIMSTSSNLPPDLWPQICPNTWCRTTATSRSWWRPETSTAPRRALAWTMSAAAHTPSSPSTSHRSATNLCSVGTSQLMMCFWSTVEF